MDDNQGKEIQIMAPNCTHRPMQIGAPSSRKVIQRNDLAADCGAEPTPPGAPPAAGADCA
jgi:hypothetical protein